MSKLNRVWYPLSLSAALLLSACMGSRSPENPPAEILPPVPQLSFVPPPQVPSRLNIPILVDLRPMLENLKAAIPDSMSAPAYREDFGTGGTGKPNCGIGCGYRVIRGPMSFRSEGAILQLNGSLGYGFRCHKRLPCAGPHFRAGCGWGREAPRTLSLRYTASLHVAKDWSTVVHTRLDSLRADSPCRVSFLRIDVAPLLLKAAEKAYAKAGPRVDSLISAHLNLRVRASKLWGQLSKPVPLAEGIFLDINPHAISATPPNLDSGRLKLTLGLTASPTIRLGAEPATRASPLPDITPADGADHFRLFVPVLLPYPDLNARLRKRFDLDSGGFRFPEKGLLQVVVDEVDISGYGDRILVRTHLRGCVRGTAYLIGVPRYDSLTQVLSVDSLAYSLESGGLMLRAANRLKHDDFVAAIQSRLTLELSGPIASLRGKVDQALNRNHGMLRFRGGLDRLEFTGVRSGQSGNALRIEFFADGKVSIEATPEPSRKPSRRARRQADRKDTL